MPPRGCETMQNQQVCSCLQEGAKPLPPRGCETTQSGQCQELVCTDPKQEHQQQHRKRPRGSRERIERARQQHEQKHQRPIHSSDDEQATGSEVPGEHLPGVERDLAWIHGRVKRGQGMQLRLSGAGYPDRGSRSKWSRTRYASNMNSMSGAARPLQNAGECTTAGAGAEAARE